MQRYGNSKSSLTKSNRYTKRVARRIPRSLTITGMNMKVEYDNQIYLPVGYNTAYFTSGTNYLDFTQILGGNPAFVSQCGNYTRYKITGVSLTATPIFTETGIHSAFGTSGVPIVYC